MDENGQFSKVPPVELIRKAIIDVRGKTASPE
jgi:hypothetical protein